MIAATPPFATKEPAADEAVEEEAGIVAVARVAPEEAGEEAVDPPVVVGYRGRVAPAPDPLAPVDPEGATEPLAPVAVAGRVNGILVGVGVPVAVAIKKKNALRKKTRIKKRHVLVPHSADCNATAAWASAIPQFDVIHEAALNWN